MKLHFALTWYHLESETYRMILYRQAKNMFQYLHWDQCKSKVEVKTYREKICKIVEGEKFAKSPVAEKNLIRAVAGKRREQNSSFKSHFFLPGFLKGLNFIIRIYVTRTFFIKNLSYKRFYTINSYNQFGFFSL